MPLGFGLSSKKDNILIMDSKGFIVDSLSYNIQINFPTLIKSENRNIERVNPVLDIWKPSVKSSPGDENDLFESIKLQKIEEEDKSVFCIGIGLVLFTLFSGTLLLLRKKRINKDLDSNN